MTAFYLNITDAPYSAVGDNSTDCTTAFQDAINAADGKPIGVPVGKYRITSKLVNETYQPVNFVALGSNGMGPGVPSESNTAQIVADFDNDHLFEISSIYQSTFKGLQFKRNSTSSTSGSALRFVGSDSGTASNIAGPVVDGCSFINFYRPISILRPFMPRFTGNYFYNWIDRAISSETTSDRESSGGWIEQNMFYGSNSGSQTCVYAEHGYININSNHILGGTEGVVLAVKAGDAGRPTITNNFLENQRIHSVYAKSQDGSKCSMMKISGNEFSNNAYVTNFEAHICVEAYSGLVSNVPWICDFDIDDNTFRSVLNTNDKYIWVQAGQRFGICRNRIVNSGAGAPDGIQLTGVANSAQLIPGSSPANYEQAIQVYDNPIRGTTNKTTFAGGAPPLTNYISSRLL